MISASPAQPAAALPVAVLGAGITGLCAAWHLQRAGVPVVLFEASPRAGGSIESHREGGWLHEGGPNSLLDGTPELNDLLGALGLGERRLEAAPAAQRRYVVRGGRLRPMPASPGAFLLGRLFTLRAKLRLASELARRRGTRRGEESVADFTVRRLGREFLDYAIEPLVGGVYAGDPHRLSLRHAFPKLFALEEEHGSLLRGAWNQRNLRGGPAGRLCSFPNGLAELTEALAADLRGPLRLEARIRAVCRRERDWILVQDRGGEWSEERCSAVICALPAPALARIEFTGFDQAAGLVLLREIEHPPVASIFTGFRRQDVGHSLDGLGLLAPKVEHCHVLGALFSSTLYPGRAPAGHVAITSFVGGSRQPELARLDDAFLQKLVVGELAQLLDLRAEPVFCRVRKHYQAIPQYNLGFERFERACAAAEGAAPGLFIGGNCRDGVSVPACIASGRRLALAAAGTRPVPPV